MAERIAIETYRDIVRYFGDNPGHALGSPNPFASTSRSPMQRKASGKVTRNIRKVSFRPACTPSELHPGGGKAAEGDVGSRFVVSIAFEVGQGGWHPVVC